MGPSKTTSDTPPHPPNLVSQYWRRLRLDPSVLDTKPTLAKLRALQEAHLAHIPFENLSQHGCSWPAKLDVTQTADKILTHHRGGFCFEVNGLLAAFLTALGYHIRRVPAWVYAADGFRSMPTHLFLTVECCDDVVGGNSDDSKRVASTWMVDVGFGEPPIHPLRCSDDAFGTVQETPEGMHSKIVKEDDEVTLYWLQPTTGEWAPRLRWNYTDSIISASYEGMSLSDFAHPLEATLDGDSIFSQKSIVCLLTRDTKIALAGNRLKTTGPPRFPTTESGGVEVETTIAYLTDEEASRGLLRDTFGIPINETKGLDLSRSLASDPSVWSQQ